MAAKKSQHPIINFGKQIFLTIISGDPQVQSKTSFLFIYFLLLFGMKINFHTFSESQQYLLSVGSTSTVIARPLPNLKWLTFDP